jgi:hypothetical protein
VVTLGVVAGWLAGLVISGGGLYHWQHNRWCYRQLLGGWLGAKLEFPAPVGGFSVARCSYLCLGAVVLLLLLV